MKYWIVAACSVALPFQAIAQEQVPTPIPELGSPAAQGSEAQAPEAQAPEAQASEVPAAEVLTAEGIAGDVDKKRRGPVVSLSTHYSKGDGTPSGESARILVDAFIPNDDYKRYPIRFDFYLNRKFFTSQIRSTELPGPIGIDISSQDAKVPFNYSLVATLLHPNREFTTVMHGAVFANDLSAMLSKCSFTVPVAQTGGESSSGKVTYIASQVQVSQTSNNSASVSFTTAELSEGEDANEVQVESNLSFSGTTASGTVKSTIDGTVTSIDVTGTGAIGENGVSAFAVANTDKSVALACE